MMTHPDVLLLSAEQRERGGADSAWVSLSDGERGVHSSLGGWGPQVDPPVRDHQKPQQCQCLPSMLSVIQLEAD